MHRRHAPTKKSRPARALPVQPRHASQYTPVTPFLSRTPANNAPPPPIGEAQSPPQQSTHNTEERKAQSRGQYNPQVRMRLNNSSGARSILSRSLPRASREISSSRRSIASERAIDLPRVRAALGYYVKH